MLLPDDLDWLDEGICHSDKSGGDSGDDDGDSSDVGDDDGVYGGDDDGGDDEETYGVSESQQNGAMT